MLIFNELRDDQFPPGGCGKLPGLFLNLAASRMLEEAGKAGGSR
jgi:hypothetical protein